MNEPIIVDIVPRLCKRTFFYLEKIEAYKFVNNLPQVLEHCYMKNMDLYLHI